MPVFETSAMGSAADPLFVENWAAAAQPVRGREDP